MEKEKSISVPNRYLERIDAQNAVWAFYEIFENIVDDVSKSVPLFNPQDTPMTNREKELDTIYDRPWSRGSINKDVTQQLRWRVRDEIESKHLFTSNLLHNWDIIYRRLISHWMTEHQRTLRQTPEIGGSLPITVINEEGYVYHFTTGLWNEIQRRLSHSDLDVNYLCELIYEDKGEKINE